jgi:glycosyltransferase involved in cell wall biosynthesis
MKQITVIIPVYNEEKIIVANMQKLMRYLDNVPAKYEIFLGDNGSTDSTLELALMLRKKYPNKIKVVSFKKKGVGRVFRKAVKDANYDNIISVDMDLSVDLDFIPRALKLLDDYDIIIGSKKMGSQQRSFLRTIPSAVFIFLVGILLGLKFKDYSMAAKAYKRSAIIHHINKIDYGSSYVIDLIYYAKNDGRKMIEIPVNCYDRRKSKFNLYNEIVYRFWNLIKLRMSGFSG